MGQIDKIVQFHISRLNDRNPDVQLKTIRELELLGEQAESAMPALQQLFKSTENEEVKKAAQRAGLTIYTKSKESK